MYQFKELNDTIAAIATPIGSAGIGVIRLTGEKTFQIADQIFTPKGRKKPSQAKTSTVLYGWIKDQDDFQIADEVLLTVMRAPKSYTTQDTVEINCHGSYAVLKAVLEIILKAGARLAEPGEFTKRAFINGRIDLTQAEAVLDVIRSRSQAFMRVSQNQLKGELSLKIQEIRQALMQVYTILEAQINFPEDDINTQIKEDLISKIEEQYQIIDKLLATSNNGRLLKEGIRVVLCGKPNVGKSSLLNALLKQHRAIVTPIAGTTRDVLEEDAQIKGIPLNLIDTAGILEPRDMIEEEAIKRSHLYIENADLILLVIDASQPLEDADRVLMDKIKDRHVIAVLNKYDLPSQVPSASIPFNQSVAISAVRGDGLEKLEDVIIKSVWQGEQMSVEGLFLTNLRQIQSFKSANLELLAALGLIDDGLSLEFISEHIKGAVNYLDAVLGRNIDEDLLDTIFSEFCIGK